MNEHQDVICGWQLIDEESRIVVVEGRRTGDAIYKLLDVLQRSAFDSLSKSFLTKRYHSGNRETAAHNPFSPTNLCHSLIDCTAHSM